MKDVQRLTGRVVALTRFISRSLDKCLPFFDLLKGNKRFEWNDECSDERSAAFKELKSYLSSPHILSKPIDGEPLYLYMAVSEHAVNLVLIREESKVQKPVYFVSKTLVDAKTRYPVIEKLALALIISARKL